MKKFFSIILAIALITCLAGCGFNGSNNTGNTDSDVTSDVSGNTANAIDNSVEPEALFTDYAPTPGLPNLIGMTPARDTWKVVEETNYIPVTPDGYTGTVADYTTQHTAPDHTMEEVTYHDVAFLTMDELDNYRDDYSAFMTVEIDGERVNGAFTCERQRMFFLEHTVVPVDEVEYFYLDVELPESDYLYVIDKTDARILMRCGAYLLVYDVAKDSCDIITDSALSYTISPESQLYFADWNHREYVCDWQETAEAVATGNTVVRYFNTDFNATMNEEFKSDFRTMQMYIKSETADYDSFSSMYEIWFDGDIYLASDGRYLSNIHLPEPYNYNRNLFYGTGSGCWQCTDTSLSYYELGEIEGESYTLPKANWQIITPGSSKSLLYNADNQSIFTVEQGSEPVMIAEHVLDFCDAYGELYWMDADYNAYELSWYEDTNSVLIGEDVAGISHYTDERAGFVVKPGDSRCNAECGGTSLCTLYGREWLNQEQTSGAWALEHDWK